MLLSQYSCHEDRWRNWIQFPLIKHIFLQSWEVDLIISSKLNRQQQGHGEACIPKNGSLSTREQTDLFYRFQTRQRNFWCETYVWIFNLHCFSMYIDTRQQKPDFTCSWQSWKLPNTNCSGSSPGQREQAWHSNQLESFQILLLLHKPWSLVTRNKQAVFDNHILNNLCAHHQTVLDPRDNNFLTHFHLRWYYTLLIWQPTSMLGGNNFTTKLYNNLENHVFPQRAIERWIREMLPLVKSSGTCVGACENVFGQPWVVLFVDIWAYFHLIKNWNFVRSAVNGFPCLPQNIMCCMLHCLEATTLNNQNTNIGWLTLYKRHMVTMVRILCRQDPVGMKNSRGLHCVECQCIKPFTEWATLDLICCYIPFSQDSSLLSVAKYLLCQSTFVGWHWLPVFFTKQTFTLQDVWNKSTPYIYNSVAQCVFSQTRLTSLKSQFLSSNIINS